MNVSTVIIYVLTAVVLMLMIGMSIKDTKFILQETRQEMVIDAKETATSFNDSQRMMITTPSGFYFINNIVSIKRNQKIEIQEGESEFGSPITRLCIENICYTTR